MERILKHSHETKELVQMPSSERVEEEKCSSSATRLHLNLLRHGVSASQKVFTCKSF